MLFYAILGMVAGANSYRQMHEFIRIHLQRLNEAFGLRLPYSPSYTGLRLIIPDVDPAALEAAFRQHAASISTPLEASQGLTAIAVDGKTLRGSFDAFSDRKAAHMMSALRQADRIVLGHLMVEEKSNEIPAAPELIEALGLKGCLFTLDAEHTEKTFERVIASGNHLLTQVKDNQPSLRRSLEQGTAGRKPSGATVSRTKGRNRWETREMKAFPAKAWFRGTPWENLIKTVLRLERTVCKRDPKTELLQPNHRDCLLGCIPPLASRRKLGTNGYAAIGASRTAAITCATSLSPRTPPASERTPTSPPACDPSPTTSSEQAEATMSETPDGAPLSISA